MSYDLLYILNILDLYDKKGLILGNYYHEEYPLRISNSLKKIEYDAIYNVKDKPIIIFKEFKKS